MIMIHDIFRIKGIAYTYRYVPDYLSLSHKKNLFHHLIILNRIQEKVKLHTFIFTFTYVNIFAVKVINQKKKKNSVHTYMKLAIIAII